MVSKQWPCGWHKKTFNMKFLVEPKKIFLLSLHAKLRLVKQFIKALSMVIVLRICVENFFIYQKLIENEVFSCCPIYVNWFQIQKKQKTWISFKEAVGSVFMKNVNYNLIIANVINKFGARWALKYTLCKNPSVVSWKLNWCKW